MIATWIVMISIGYGANAADQTLEGHFSRRGGRTYSILNANADYPEFSVAWAREPTDPAALCLWNYNHSCRRVKIRVARMRLATRELEGVSLVR